MVLQDGIESAKPSGSDTLGRYYTKCDIGDLLIGHMGAEMPRGLLDLGSGAGTLSRAAAKRWAETNIVTVDVDTSVSTRLKAFLRVSARGRHNHIRADALSTGLPELIRTKLGDIDAAVCNPPFIRPAWRKGFGEILEDVGLSCCLPATGDVDAALLFLAQNLRMIAAGARLGIILPDTMMSTVRYRRFRQELLRRYTVERIIKLPRGSFLGTDALASIAIIQKYPPTGEAITLCKFTVGSQITPEICVTADQAIHRFDYDYHKQVNLRVASRTRAVSLAELSAEVRRGSVENAVAKTNGIPVFHTSDMDTDRLGAWLNLSGHLSRGAEPTVHVCAELGDILVARVGRNLENKTCGVFSGAAVLTDCVYRVRLPERYQQTVLAQLASAAGQEWLASRTYGVGARQLTKADLLTFPIVL